MTNKLIFFAFAGCLNQAFSQSDTTHNTSHRIYFTKQSALPLPEKSLTYNNHYFLFNSFSYNFNKHVSIGAGIALLPGTQLPSFISVHYVTPLAPKIHIGMSAMYVRLAYNSIRSDYLFLPQSTLTLGDANTNVTFGFGTGNGQFTFPIDFNNSLNLPNRIRSFVSLSYNRKLSKQFYFTTQNHYLSILAPPGQRNWSETFIFAVGGNYNYQKHSFKAGISTLYFPLSATAKSVRPFPYLGYSLTIK